MIENARDSPVEGSCSSSSASGAAACCAYAIPAAITPKPTTRTMIKVSLLGVITKSSGKILRFHAGRAGEFQIVCGEEDPRFDGRPVRQTREKATRRFRRAHPLLASHQARSDFVCTLQRAVALGE